ncbi:reverse transcriptase domain-containing protein [Tenacibaculum sp. FZY0031]|uniref:reverse transcriptase domain-containing protein n=1 Tax=Tenacibaculum sp. FZY0031 TaxID=3116648 RepID=UPI002EA27453|nr:reverse transcriptase domain-containing protein [Tenacibaculum sp. FZY0031]
MALALTDYYQVKKHVHSYVKKKGIKTNAKIHTKQKFVINIDLCNFFESINFGRVRGMFKSHPFNFNDEVSTILAQLCCHDNKLPQGSPCSPIISNLITRKLDNELKFISKTNKCYYSRYSDDITFSTNLKRIPKKIGKIKKGNFILSKLIKKTIDENGFKINTKKVTLRRYFQHQYVTGLTVNKKVNVKKRFLKQVRAMLHSWEVNGLEIATIQHFKKRPHKNKSHNTNLFINIVEGKLLFISDIRGKKDKLFLSLLKKFEKLKPDNSLNKYLNYDGKKIRVFTEGNTDWIHLQHALNSLSVYDYKLDNLKKSIEIVDYDENYTVGDNKLKHILEAYLLSKEKTPIIGIFDSDNLNSLGQFRPNTGYTYKNFNNIVFSFYLPQPKHRNISKLCIEHYYKDDDLKIKDKNNRRLFLSNEFDPETGLHKKDPKLKYTQSFKKLKSSQSIIDSGVFDKKDKSYALSKKDFAKNILNKDERFKRVNVDSFRIIFDEIQNIITQINTLNQKHH